MPEEPISETRLAVVDDTKRVTVYCNACELELRVPIRATDPGDWAARDAVLALRARGCPHAVLEVLVGF